MKNQVEEVVREIGLNFCTEQRTERKARVALRGSLAVQDSILVRQ